MYFLKTFLGSPRPINSSLTNQTYSTCEGAELNMTASFLSNPGPIMGWYLSPDTSGRPLYYTDERGYGSIIHHTNYYIPLCISTCLEPGLLRQRIMEEAQLGEPTLK